MTIPLHAHKREMWRVVKCRSRDDGRQFVLHNFGRLAVNLRPIDFDLDERLAQLDEFNLSLSSTDPLAFEVPQFAIEFLRLTLMVPC